MREHLITQVQAHDGVIAFSRFMYDALYAPGLGYYSAGATKFAEAGDFTTAPEVSPLFSGVMARQCASVLDEIDGGDVVEFGAGSGRMAADILNGLASCDRLPAHYYIVEVSADLRARQRATLERDVPDLAGRVSWVDDPATLSIDGAVIANEVLDALPVERFRIGERGVEQQTVALEHDELVLSFRPAPDALSGAVASLQRQLGRALPVGYESEICLMMPAWLGTLSATLRRGVVVLSDYGYGRRDYYAPERDRGTLTCHFRHHAHHEPLLWPGIQDITAWVDFSLAAESLRDCGLGYLGFTTQSQFLLHGGITELLAQAGSEISLELSRGVKTLTLPGEMGERFRFIGFHRDCPLALAGFSGRDYGMQL